jgi:beta-aspartyl-peptidase (threonine type)
MLRLKSQHSRASSLEISKGLIPDIDFTSPLGRRLAPCILLLATGLVFCSPQKSEFGLLESALTQDSEPSTQIAEVLHGIISEQQKAWNRGDIDVFMGAYWKDERLTFSSGGATTRGYQATLERYRKRYPDRAAMGLLAFEGLETTSLGPTSAYTLGQWKLAKAEAAQGNFTLVWQKIDGEWKIVHDHSSQATSR